MAWQFDTGIFSVVGLNGEILPGATLTFYASGTSTKLATYSTPALDAPHANANPLSCGEDGRFPTIWMQEAAYKVVLTLPNATTITRDPVSSPFSTDFTDTDSYPTGSINDILHWTGVRESDQPANAKWMLVIPETEPTYRDNVITIQNISHQPASGGGRTANVGNAALRFKAGDGREVAAAGFSALDVGEDTSHPTYGSQFYPRLFYLEVSDLSGGDATYGPPDFAVIVTNLASNVYFPNTSFRPFEHKSTTGLTYVRARTSGGGYGTIGLEGNVYVGGIANPALINVGMHSSYAIIRERVEDDFFGIATNTIGSDDSSDTQSNTAKSSWYVEFGAGSSLDCFRIRRRGAAAANPPVDMLKVANDGSIHLKPVAAASVTAPASGYFALFLNASDGNKLSKKDSANNVTVATA